MAWACYYNFLYQIMETFNCLHETVGLYFERYETLILIAGRLVLRLAAEVIVIYSFILILGLPIQMSSQEGILAKPWVNW